MDSNRIAGKWKQIRGAVKSRWGELTDDELDRAEGNMDYLVGRVQERYGLSKDEVHKELEDMATKH